MQVAAQMYTLRDFTKTREGFVDALEKVAQIGYPAVQLSAVGCMEGESPEVSAADAKAILDQFGLACCATHRSIDRLVNHTDAEIKFHRTLGCTYTAIGGAWGYPNTAEGYRKLIADLTPAVQALKSAGITFGYHNHSHEFIRATPTHSCLDILIEEGGPDWQFEVDTYWVQNAGVDPAGFLAALAGRLDAVHLKDREVVEKDGAVMAPVGEGNLDWEGILQACQGSGTKWLIVEQDVCRRDPFDCLKSSFEYLTGLLS